MTYLYISVLSFIFIFGSFLFLVPVIDDALFDDGEFYRGALTWKNTFASSPWAHSHSIFSDEGYCKSGMNESTIPCVSNNTTDTAGADDTGPCVSAVSSYNVFVDSIVFSVFNNVVHELIVIKSIFNPPKS